MKCEACKFWEVHCSEADKKHRTQRGGSCEKSMCRVGCENDVLGFCRRYPPVKNFEDDVNVPDVYVDDWCGEFKEK